MARDSLLSQNRLSYIDLIGRTVYTTGSQYSYVLNANKLNTYRNFVYFRGNVDVGGNTLDLVANILNTPKDNLGERTLLDTRSLNTPNSRSTCGCIKTWAAKSNLFSA